MKKTIFTLFLLIVSGFGLFAQEVKIMPLGDSITGSPGCWRAMLWAKLVENGYKNIDFVGTQPPQGCGIPHDGDNEGHGGALVTSVADQNQLTGWLAKTNPDIVLMHFGTNDAWSNRSTTQILDAYTTLVNQMRENNPQMKVIVAQIIPLDPWQYDCPGCPQRVIDLNAAIPGWAASLSTTQSPVIVVDQWTGFSTDDDTSDGVHPIDSGSQKMADRWYPALGVMLSGEPVPTKTPSFLKGDANSDGTVNIIDALLIAQYAVTLPTPGINLNAADFDVNGIVNILDALMIAQCYVGLISCL